MESDDQESDDQMDCIPETVRSSPYRTMKQDPIKIPQRRGWILYLGAAFVVPAAMFAGALFVHRFDKVESAPHQIHTVHSVKVVEKVVSVPVTPSVCLDKMFMTDHFKAIQCDNANHILHYKNGDKSALCECKR